MPRPTDVLAGDVALTLEIDGVEYQCEATSVVLAHAEDDRVTATFCDPEPARGVFTITALSRTASGAFWTALWDSAGDKNVPFTFAPWGNATASVSQPHFTGELDIPRLRPQLGGEAGTAEHTFDVEILTSKGVEVLKVTA